MTLDEIKNSRKAYLNGVGYEVDMRTNITINNNGNVYTVPHSIMDITQAEQVVDIHNPGDNLIIQGINLPYDDSVNLIYTCKVINDNLYNHLWTKYQEVDAATSESAVNAIDWEFDITQTFSSSVAPHDAGDDPGIYDINWEEILNKPYIPGESRVRAWVREMFEERGL